MIKPRENQKGFTLIELLVAIALAAVISTAATMAIHQVITIIPRNNNQNTAINQVRNAVHWISRDAQMANDILDSSGGAYLLKLTVWEDYTGSITSTIIYSLEDTPDGLNKLKRSKADSSGTTETFIAQYIDPASTNCSWNSAEKVLTVNITAQVGTRTETRTFQVKPRPD